VSDFIRSGIGAALEYGIDLQLESPLEEQYYTEKMCEYFNTSTDFKAYSSGEASFEIEFDKNSPIMEVIIRDSVLYMIPYTEDIFEVFTLVLNFIAKKHRDIVAEFRGVEEMHKIESLNNFEPEQENFPVPVLEDEDDDDDDYEWI
jgi:hypothetical protein